MMAFELPWLSFLTLLDRLAYASLAGAAVLALVWALTRLITGSSATVRCWLWRLALAKLLLAFAVAWAVELPWLPAPPAMPPVKWGEPPETTFDRMVLLSSRIRISASEAVADTMPETGDEEVSRPVHAAHWIALPLPAWALALLSLWALGAAFASLRAAAAWLQSRRVRARAVPAGDALTQLAAGLAARLGLARPPPLLLLEEANGPMLVGLLRPAIVLPARLASRSTDELRMILGHELAHFRRGDLAWNLLPALAQALFFFHPLVWLAVRELALDQETAADELALAASEAPVKSYGELLLGFVTTGASQEPLVAMHASATGALLKRRLARLGSRAGTLSSTAAVALVAGVGLAALVPLKIVRAEPRFGGVSMAIKDAPVDILAATIASNAGFTVLVDPKVAKQKVGVNLRDVEALSALRQVAAGHGLRFVRVPYATGRPAYMLLGARTPDPVRRYQHTSDATGSMAISDASVTVILETLAINSGCNVVIDPALNGIELSVSFEDRPVHECINMVADVANVAITEEPNPGGHPTYIMRPR